MVMVVAGEVTATPATPHALAEPVHTPPAPRVPGLCAAAPPRDIGFRTATR
jgi:hypothetical protein